MDLTEEQYERRFWQRNDGAEKLNVLGYGESNPFVPPLVKPPSILAVYDRFALTVSVHWFWLVQHYSLIANNEMGQGNADMFYYNNPEAVGHQLYPTGIHKYYDLYSEDGFWGFFWMNILHSLELVVLPWTSLPISVWLAMLDDSLSWDGWYNFLLYPPKYAYWNIPVLTQLAMFTPNGLLFSFLQMAGIPCLVLSTFQLEWCE